MVAPYERAIKRLGQRDWNEIRGTWSKAVAQLNLSSAGTPPVTGLENLPKIDGLLKLVSAQVPSSRAEEFDGLQPTLIHEGIYLAHKAACVLVSAHDGAGIGSPTWSLATAYQAAYFAACSMLRLLGVADMTVNRRSYLIDAFPPVDPTLSQKLKKFWVLGSDSEVIFFPDSLSHFHVWAIFKRCLRTTANLPFDDSLLEAIQSIDEKEFAEERNMLHYRSTWAFGDLSSYIELPAELQPADREDLLRLLQPATPGFGLALGTLLVLFAARLLSSAAEQSPSLASEVQLLASACSDPRLRLKAAYEAASDMTFA